MRRKNAMAFTPSLEFRLPQSVPSRTGDHTVSKSNVFPPASSGRQKTSRNLVWGLPTDRHDNRRKPASRSFLSTETLIYHGFAAKNSRGQSRLKKYEIDNEKNHKPQKLRNQNRDE